MSILNAAELRNTREKLRLLERRCAELNVEPAPNAHLRDLTLRSLKKLVNQLKEEIARFEAQAAGSARGDHRTSPSSPSASP